MPQTTSKNPASSLPVSGGLTAEELAAGLRCSPRTLTEWERLGRIPPAIRIGRRRLWPASTVAALLGTAVQEGGAA
jgi:predicted site-specific integrase-resolvase